MNENNSSTTTIIAPLSVCALLSGTPEFIEHESCGQNFFRVMSWSYQGADHNVRALIEFPSFLKQKDIIVESIHLTLKHWSNQEENAKFYSTPVHGFGNYHYVMASSLEIKILSTPWPQGKMKNWQNQPPLKKKSVILPPPRKSTSDFNDISITSLGAVAAVRHGLILKMSEEKRYRGLVFAGSNTSTVSDRPVARIKLTRLHQLTKGTEDLISSFAASDVSHYDTYASRNNHTSSKTKPSSLTPGTAFYITLIGNFILALGLLLIYLCMRKKMLRYFRKRPAAANLVQQQSSMTWIDGNYNAVGGRVDNVNQLEFQTKFEEDIRLKSAPESVHSNASSYIHLDHEELIIDRHLLEEDSLDLSDRNPSTCGDDSPELEQSGYIHISESV